MGLFGAFYTLGILGIKYVQDVTTHYKDICKMVDTNNGITYRDSKGNTYLSCNGHRGYIYRNIKGNQILHDSVTGKDIRNLTKEKFEKEMQEKFTKGETIVMDYTDDCHNKVVDGYRYYDKDGNIYVYRQLSFTSEYFCSCYINLKTGLIHKPFSKKCETEENMKLIKAINKFRRYKLRENKFKDNHEKFLFLFGVGEKYNNWLEISRKELEKWMED